MDHVLQVYGYSSRWMAARLRDEGDFGKEVTLLLCMCVCVCGCFVVFLLSVLVLNQDLTYARQTLYH